VRRLTAVSLLVLVVAMLHVGAARADYTDPACEQDGNDISAANCAPPADFPQPPADLDLCLGAVYCDLTYSLLDVAGFSSVNMQDEDVEAIDDLNVQMAGTSGSSFGGWVSFYDYHNEKCSGTVNFNNHCAWLYHKYRIYVNGEPEGQTITSVFPASSGNNIPNDKWTPDTGPIPNNFKASAGGSTRDDYRWGRTWTTKTGYEPRDDDSYYPGRWHLDPGQIYNPNDTAVHRNAFFIHGGRHTDGSSRLWDTPTHGCIRLSIEGIRGLKGKWDNKTDNKGSAKAYVRLKA